MRFHLSNTQRKELERGTGLLIALPLPRQEIGEPRAWAVDRLAVAPEWVRGAELDEIDCDPAAYAGAGILPAIVGERASPEHLTLRVRIVKVTLAERDRRLRTTAKVQWPGGAIERAPFDSERNNPLAGA